MITIYVLCDLSSGEPKNICAYYSEATAIQAKINYTNQDMIDILNLMETSNYSNERIADLMKVYESPFFIETLALK